MIITHAAAVHGLDISPEPVDLARVALKRLGLIGKGTERDRRPSTDEFGVPPLKWSSTGIGLSRIEEDQRWLGSETSRKRSL